MSDSKAKKDPLNLAAIESEIQRIQSKYPHLKKLNTVTNSQDAITERLNSQKTFQHNSAMLRVSPKKEGPLRQSPLRAYTALSHTIEDKDDSSRDISSVASQLMPKDVSREFQSSVNPKDLSNEELEFVIRTGKVPP